MRRRSSRTAAPGIPVRLRSHLRSADVLLLGTSGLRTRPMRAVLSALGIAIGIAAMIAVVGISASSREQLNERLAALGTNLLTLQPGETVGGRPIPLPQDAGERIRRISGVELVSATGRLGTARIYRNRTIAPGLTAGIVVQAADLQLLAAVGGHIQSGRWLNPATASFPTVVLGRDAAQRLGVAHAGGLLWMGGRNVSVVGVLGPVALVPDLDNAALIGNPVASDVFGFNGRPTSVYVRSTDATVPAVRTLLGPSVQPQTPTGVAISRPSDALAAKNVADQAFTGLLLALGSIALLVGGIGVANTMVITVLERRHEIGLRRALGATRRHIQLQFLTEALLLSTLGGLAGAVLGAVVSAAFALANGWSPVIPEFALVGGVIATTLIGGIAGLYPAVRAARTPPTEALGS